MDNIFTKKITNIITDGGYTYEQVMNSKNTSKNPKYWYLIASTSDSGDPRFLFKSKVAESWEFFDPEIYNPISNTNQIYLRFLDVSGFTEPSNYFRKNKVYTRAPENTLIWNRYWDDLEDKIENGFEIEGVRITGRHFFLINFGRFRAIPVDEHGNSISSRKIWTFLRFLDHQYYLMHELEDCLLEGNFKNWDDYKKWFPLKNRDNFITQQLQSFALSKARRKGWTANIAIGVFNYNFTFIESSMSILAAYEKAHYGPMLRSIHNTKSFLDKNTPWKRRTEIKGTNEHMIAGVEVTDEYGMKIKEGYLSEINAVSFKDNPFKGIGESADVINIEEAGKFDRLTEAYPISMEPLIRDGETIIGISIAGGTAGDMESGGSEGLARVMYNPEGWGFRGYENIYEENQTNGKTGWFIDDLWYSPIRVSKEELLRLNNSDRTQTYVDKFEGNYVDAVDIHGNSYRYISEIVLEEKREKRRKISGIAYQKFITQQPKYLSEAFLLNESSPFDTATAKEVLGQLAIEKIGEKRGVFALSGGKSKFILDMNRMAIDSYKYKGLDTTGCWVIYEDPVTLNGEIMSWRYIGGCDPIDWGSDEVSSVGAHSFAATYIIDTITRNIVAEYISRPRKAEDYFEQLWRGLEYYNAILLYENNLKGLFSYFRQKNKLSLLATDPESLKDRFGYKANNRTKGFHANPASNNYAKELIHRWTLEEVVMGQDELTGAPIFVPRMFFIKSKGLLEEIISYHSKGNFDRISSLGAAMILLFDREWDTEDDHQNQTSILDEGIFSTIRDLVNRENKFKFLK